MPGSDAGSTTSTGSKLSPLVHLSKSYKASNPLYKRRTSVETKGRWISLVCDDFSGRKKLKLMPGLSRSNSMMSTFSSFTAPAGSGSRGQAGSRQVTAKTDNTTSLPSIKRGGGGAMGSNFRNTYGDILDRGIKYTNSGQPHQMRYRDTDDYPSLEQIQRINKDRKKGPKIKKDIHTEKVGGVKIPTAPAFKQSSKQEVSSMVDRLSNPPKTRREEHAAKRLERDSEMSVSECSTRSRLADRDKIQRERDFNHLQRDTLMSRIRQEVTRLFAPDPYGVRDHKWPW